MSGPAPALVALGIAGALVGLLAERLAARWPAHEDGSVRSPGWRTGVLVVAGAAAFGALPLRWSEPRDLAILVGWFTVLLVLAATDLDQRLLPDLITLPLIPVVLLLMLSGWDPLLADKSQPVLSGVLAGVGAPVVLAVSSWVLRGGLGLGDVKLAVSLGLMAGVLRLVGGLVVASAGSAFVLVALLGTRRLGLRSMIPFGPVLIAGGICAAFVG